jgi:hypothetical protein
VSGMRALIDAPSNPGAARFLSFDGTPIAW